MLNQGIPVGRLPGHLARNGTFQTLHTQQKPSRPDFSLLIHWPKNPSLAKMKPSRCRPYSPSPPCHALLPECLRNGLIWLFAASCLLLPSTVLVSAKEKAMPNGDDWLTFYYRNPRPDQVVTRLKAWSAEGTLKDENARIPLIGFFSQVFRHNASQVHTWYQQIKNLPEDDLETITTAIWISNTEEGMKLLETENPILFEKKTPPDILTLKLDSPSTLDLLWGFYYATGDSKVLRRIVTMFNYADVTKKPEGLPEGRTPLYTILPDAAKWSLSTNARQHPKILKDCTGMLAGDQLNATEKKWLNEALQAAENASKQP